MRDARRTGKIIALIELEMEWCKNNPGVSGKGADFEAGFSAGLKQAMILIETLLKQACETRSAI